MTVDPWTVPLPAELVEFEGMPSEDELARTIGAITDRAERLLTRITGDVAAAALADPDVPEPLRRFRPESDGAAEWVARLGARAQRVVDADREQAAEWRRQIDRWEAETHRGDKATVAWADALLSGYALGLREVDADRKTVKLPSAVVRTTERQPSPKVMDGKADEYVGWAQTHAPDTLKVTPVVSKFKGAVEVGKVLDGWDVVAVLSCGHDRAWFLPLPDGWDGTAPDVLDSVPCYECSNHDFPEREVTAATIDPRLRVAVLSVADGEEVPGLEVDPGGITAKVTF